MGTKKRRTSQQITLNERQEQALAKLYAWEFAASLITPLSTLKRRDEYLSKVIEHPFTNDNDRQIKLCQRTAVRDAGIARGLYSPVDDDTSE